MTNPGMGWSALRRAVGKRLSHHSVARKPDGLGVQTEPLPSAWPSDLVRGQRIGKMATLEAVNGKCRFLGTVRSSTAFRAWFPRASLLVS